MNNIPTGSLYTTQAPTTEPQTLQSPTSTDNSASPRKNRGNKAEKFAKYISYIFSPFLIPAYCAMTALWATKLSAAPVGARLSSAVVILLLTCLLPWATMLGAMRIGKITDTDVSKRKQRIYLYPVAITAYLLCALYLSKVHAPSWLSGTYLGMGISAIIAFIVNFRWKISVHGTACGCLLAFMFYIAINHLSDLFFMPWLSVAVLITGTVASSRLILKSHTMAQVIAGISTGLIVTGLVSIFI